RDRRAQPADGYARPPRRAADQGASAPLLPRLAGGLPGRGLAARPDLPLALADPRGRLRRLPVPQAGHLARAPVARGARRAPADWRAGLGSPGASPGPPWRGR